MKPEKIDNDYDKSQDEINLQLDLFKASLSDEDEEKFRAIDEIIGISIKHGIPMLLFPYMMGYYNKMGCYQYNNLAVIQDQISEKKSEKEGEKMIAEFNKALDVAVLAYYTSKAKRIGFGASEYFRLLEKRVNSDNQ